MASSLEYLTVHRTADELSIVLITGKARLIRHVPLTQKQAAEMAIELIRWLAATRDEEPNAIVQARRAGALEVLRRVDDEAVAPDARAWLAEIADEYGGFGE